MSDIFHNFLYSIQIFPYLYNVTNKQINNKQRHFHFIILPVTILFTVLISDTFHDFPFSIDTCHYLPNVTNKNQTNKEQYLMWCRHFTQDDPQCPISTQISHKMSHSVLSVHTFHTICPTVSYQYTHFTQDVPLCPISTHISHQISHCVLSVHTFHTRCPTVSYQYKHSPPSLSIYIIIIIVCGQK
jgi:hypothetical protein